MAIKTEVEQLLDNPQLLLEKIINSGRELKKANETLKKMGREMAEKEARYRVELASKMLELRSKGEAVTIISDLCRGDKTVATYRFHRDVAKTNYETQKSLAYDLRLEVEMLRSALVWLRAEIQNEI